MDADMSISLALDWYSQRGIAQQERQERERAIVAMGSVAKCRFEKVVVKTCRLYFIVIDFS
jgi:hypothetical protein